MSVLCYIRDIASLTVGLWLLQLFLISQVFVYIPYDLEDYQFICILVIFSIIISVYIRFSETSRSLVFTNCFCIHDEYVCTTCHEITRLDDLKPFLDSVRNSNSIFLKLTLDLPDRLVAHELIVKYFQAIDSAVTTVHYCSILPIKLEYTLLAYVTDYTVDRFVSNSSPTYRINNIPYPIEFKPPIKDIDGYRFFQSTNFTYLR